MTSTTRRLALALMTVILSVTVIFWITRPRQVPATGNGPASPPPSATKEELQQPQQDERPVAPPIPRRAMRVGAADWPRWGGAINSAHSEGPGFFDTRLRRDFSNDVAEEEQKYIIDLNARALLPLTGADGAGFVKTLGNDGASHIVYLQFREHPSDAQRGELARLGIELISYAAGYAWVARGTNAAFAEAGKLPEVRAMASIDPRDKLLTQVFRGATPPYALDANGNTRFWVLAVPGTAPEVFGASLAGAPTLAGLKALPALPSVLGPRFEVVAPAVQAAEIAALDATAFVEYIPPPAVSRDATTDAESNINDVRDDVPNLNGTGVTVAVREIGKPVQHADFSARTQFVDSNGLTDSGNRDHATAVVGQLGSSGVAQPTAKGVAPSVTMLIYSLANAVGQTGETFSSADMADAAGRGARISNHSYGPNVSSWGDYQTISADWDSTLRANNMLGTFAGNEEDGGNYKHIDYFVGAKNTLCVEATNGSAQASDITPLTPKSDGIAFFSEFGPMNDGRVKPDLVAYGTNVTLDQGANGTQTNSGTSFSTPTVAGAAALVYQHYKTKVGAGPSAALAKALLCNAATDLGVAGPDATYGFGILNAEEAVNTINLRNSSMNTPFLESVIINGDTRTFNVTVQNLPQLKVTLCWFDPQGTPAAAKALVNDLDLVLTAPDNSKHYPYSLSAVNPSAAATNSGANVVDPIEQVIVDAPANGTWKVTVTGTSIPQGSQAFAVCVNTIGSKNLTAQISPSSTTGEAPLQVSFSASLSTGTIQTYTWYFGDGLTGSGENVQHTYAVPGTYSAMLVITDGQGGSDLAIVEITVLQPTVQVYASKAKGKLAFPAPGKAAKPSATSLQFTVVAQNLILTAQQARDAVKNGTFEGKVYKIRAGPPGGPLIDLRDFTLSRQLKGGKSGETIKIKLTTGEITVTLKGSDDRPLQGANRLFDALGITGSTASPLTVPMRVEIEPVDVRYMADFQLLYTRKKTTGTVVSPIPGN